MRANFLVGLILALLSPTPLSAAQQAAPSIALKGLPGVLVVVEELDPSTGLTQADLTREVEQWLQQGGIKTFSREQFATAEGLPALYVYIDSREAPELNGLLLFEVRVALYETVLLPRLSGTPVLASTWDSEFGLSYADPAPAKTFIPMLVHEVIDKFIAEYKAASAAPAPARIAAAPPKPPPAPSATKPTPAPSATKPPPTKVQERPAKAPAARPADPKRVVLAARTIGVRQNGGAPSLQSAIERELESWGRFAVVMDLAQADLVIDVSATETKAVAVLQTPDGFRLWSTAKEGKEVDESPADFPKIGEAIVRELRSFVPR